jgi:hypothetical protein
MSDSGSPGGGGAHTPAGANHTITSSTEKCYSHLTAPTPCRCPGCARVHLVRRCFDGRGSHWDTWGGDAA